MTTINWREMCLHMADELDWYRQLLTDDRREVHPMAVEARLAQAQSGPEAAGPTDEELDAWITECADATRYGPLEHYWAFDVQFDHVRDIASAVLARWGHQLAPLAEVGCPACEGVPKPGNQPCAVCGRPAPVPAEGEVAELVARLRRASDGASAMGWEQDSWIIARAADLLEQRHPAPVPVGMIPVEYWDIDSGARIVSEPSEDGPGGCWIVLNSRYVNPLTEFPTAKAAWDALQQATALPLPGVEVE